MLFYLVKPVLLGHDVAARGLFVVNETVVEQPVWLFLCHGLLQLLLLEVLTLHFLSLLLRQLDFLDLGSFLRTNSLELDCSAFVAELRDQVPQVQFNAILLHYVVKRKLDDDLTESWIFLRLFNCDWRPDDIDNLRRVSLLIRLFADFAE